MIAPGSLVSIQKVIRAAIQGRQFCSFGSIDSDAADWLDRQGHAVLVRRASLTEYIVSPRVKR